MPKPVFATDRLYIPSESLRRQAENLGVLPQNLLRDWYAFGGDEQAAHVAVGDMANNIVGTNITDPELAGRLELPTNFRFNGGLLASHGLRRFMEGQRATGTELVAGANKYLTELYRKIGTATTAAELQAMDPAMRFTGYLSHVQFAPKETAITSVGDVMVWVNGKHVSGVTEKLIDTDKAQLVDELTRLVWDAPVEDVERTVREFAGRTGLDQQLTDELLAGVLKAKSQDKNKQAVYKPVDNLVTPWQIRNLQNPASDTVLSPYHYGAIDGTSTPDGFVETTTIPTGDIDRVVIATDGLMPVSTEVNSFDDLEPANPEYGEQTAVVLRRTK